MPTPNTALARRVLEHIEAHPEQWNQRRWAVRSECGTSFCFAGHAVHLTHPDALYLFGLDLLDGDERNHAVKVLIPGRPGPEYVRDVAVQLLGLSDYDARLLFHASNTLEHLHGYVDQLQAPAFTGPLVCLNDDLSTFSNEALRAYYEDDAAADDASYYEEDA